MARRINGEGTVWHVPSEKRWRGAYYVGGTRRTLSGKDRKTVEVKLREALTARDNNTLENTAKQAGSVAEALDAFLVSKSNKEYKTYTRYQLDVERYLKPEIGSRKLASLTAEDIEAAYMAIQKTHGLSGTSMVHIHATMRGTIKRALRLKKIKGNPMEGVNAPTKSTKYRKPLTQADMKLVLNAAKSQGAKWNALWRITLMTGFRQGEVLCLTWEDFNLEDGSLYIHRQIQRQTGKGLVIKDLKTHARGRTIDLDQETVAALKLWRKEQTQQRLAMDTWGSENFIFTNSVGKPIEPRKSSRMWAALLESAGLPHLNLHGARHSLATMMMELGVEVKVVSHYLGHSDVSTTQNIYQHISKEVRKQTAKTLDDLAM